MFPSQTRGGPYCELRVVPRFEGGDADGGGGEVSLRSVRRDGEHVTVNERGAADTRGRPNVPTRIFRLHVKVSGRERK